MMEAARYSEMLVNPLIVLMMKTARSSETLVNFYQSKQRYNPEDSHFQKPVHSSMVYYVLLYNAAKQMFTC
jgi:hypothetical protein